MKPRILGSTHAAGERCRDGVSNVDEATDTRTKRTARPPREGILSHSGNGGSRTSGTAALHVLLGQTIEFLLRAGESPISLSMELERQAARVKRRGSTCRLKDIAKVWEEYERFAKVCGVVHDWHREAEFTNRQASPRQLTPATLKRLIARRFPKRKVGATMQWMFKKGIVRRTKDGSVALIGGRTVVLTNKGRRELALERAAVVVPQYLRIALRNAQSSDADSRDLDRDARVFSLPEKYVPLWRAMARDRAQAFLEGMDNWLEDHSSEEDVGRVREVAVHCYAYTGDRARPRRSGRGVRGREVGNE
jgi:hypothetical protein